MNRYQKAVTIMAAVNILLMVLFPPFLDNPLQRGMPRSLEGFYFVFMAPPGRAIYEPLLSLALLAVLANALAAWLALADAGRRFDMAAAARGLLLFGAANLAVAFLFPPFETYATLIRSLRTEGFDGFYFAFGDKRHRAFFKPLLYLEVIVVVVNLLVAWLVFGLIRSETSTRDERLVAAARRLAPAQQQALLESLERRARKSATPHEIGRQGERRRKKAGKYGGPERRSGKDRRRGH
jgi:hypothetical protein